MYVRLDQEDTEGTQFMSHEVYKQWPEAVNLSAMFSMVNPLQLEWVFFSFPFSFLLVFLMFLDD